jgi:outer membrane immunogenic protein
MLQSTKTASLVIALMASTPVFAAETSQQAQSTRLGHSWEGFYAGVNIGYGWGSSGGDFAFAQPVGAPGISSFSTNASYSTEGVLGGIQFGRNWRANNVLYGLEADLQASGQKGSTSARGLIPGVSFSPGANPLTLSTSERLDWLSTIRGRLGLINGSWLLYATGGLAIGEISTNGIFAPDRAAAGANIPGAWSGSEIRLGWTLGAGVEAAISDQWSWKLEYLYVNLGNFSGSSSIPNSNCYGTPGICDITAGLGSTKQNYDNTNNVARIGLNYKFY